MSKLGTPCHQLQTTESVNIIWTVGYLFYLNSAYGLVKNEEKYTHYMNFIRFLFCGKLILFLKVSHGFIMVGSGNFVNKKHNTTTFHF